jgi:hypothetical protein
LFIIQDLPKSLFLFFTNKTLKTLAIDAMAFAMIRIVSCKKTALPFFAVVIAQIEVVVSVKKWL